MSMQEEHKQKDLQAKLEAKAQIVHNNSSSDSTILSTEKNDTLQNYLNQEKLLDEILQIREELRVSLNFL